MEHPEGMRPLKQNPLEGERFKNAAIAVHEYLKDGACDQAVIGDCIDAIHHLMQTGLAHDPQRPDLMYYINTALLHIYPHMGTAQVPEILGLLEEEKELLERIQDKKTLTGPEGEQLFTFCQEMGVQLRLLESDLTPHFRTDHE